MKHRIDINCDMGESYGHYRIGNDSAVMPHISSCNIACGFHAGDPYHIHTTIKKALQHKLAIGAHPSYPDLQGFGRRKITISTEELRAIVLYQVSALIGICSAEGGKVSYVKPHGALYNSVAVDDKEAKTVVDSILHLDKSLKILGLPNSAIEQYCIKNGVEYIREGFIDRSYQTDGTLSPRSSEGSVIIQEEEKLKQFEGLVLRNEVQTIDGKKIAMEVDSICIHGDHEGSDRLAKSLADISKENNIQIKAI